MRIKKMTSLKSRRSEGVKIGEYRSLALSQKLSTAVHASEARGQQGFKQVEFNVVELKL